MEKKIDYEAEVRKVYPEAFCVWKPKYRDYHFEGWSIYSSPLSYGKELGSANNEDSAWRDAYNNLKVNKWERMVLGK